MPAGHRSEQSRRLTLGGLLAMSAATLLMSTWAVFPTAAFATIPWNGNGVTDGNLNTERCDAFDMDRARGGDSAWQGTTTFFAPGSITASVDGATESGNLVISYGCPGETTTTTETTTSQTETMTSQTETTTSQTETTTSGSSTTQTTASSSSTTPTGTTSVSGTTFTSTGSGSTPPGETTMLLTTVTPGGPAFTGIENVVPLGAVALILMTGGSGLMWAGARRRRNDEEGDE